MDSMSQMNPQQVFTSAFSNNTRNLSNNTMVPSGLIQLQAHCASVYPTQTPLCLRPSKSFILNGGSCPLDYIYIYKNEGSHDIDPHWHYIGFGLSDIHYYSLLYDMNVKIRSQSLENFKNIPPLQQMYPIQLPNTEKLSGFGFELTFRVKCDSPDLFDQEPPQWPGKVMQELARYVFQSRNVFSEGDHAAWHCSLDHEESNIEHMLMTIDPQLKEVITETGKVKFIQLVGVCQEELQAAREWNVRGVLMIMKERQDTGGNFLITDMRRGGSIFELDSSNRDRIDNAIETMGSDLTQITAKHKYSASKPKWFKEAEVCDSENHYQDDLGMNEEHEPLENKSEINNTTAGVERGNFLTMCREESQPTTSQHDYQFTGGSRNPSRMSYESESALMIENAELVDTRYYDSVYLLLTYESAKVLPVILKGRLKHDRHFTFQSFKGDLTTSLVPQRSVESLVSRDQPFAKKGIWLQIYVSDELRQQMIETIEADFDLLTKGPMTCSKNYSWPDHKFHITIERELKET